MRLIGLLCLSFLGTLGVRAADAVRPNEPVDLSGIQIHFPENDNRLVRVRGVLDFVTAKELGGNWYWATLRTPTIKVGLALPSSRFSGETLRRLVNAELSVCGLVRRADGTPQSLPLAFGVHVVPRSGEDIEVLRPTPQDPFSAPPLGEVSRHVRQRLSGTVAAIGRLEFILESADGVKYLVFPSEDVRTPAFGTPVTVVGFVERQDPHFLTLQNALVRTDGPGTKVPPTPSIRLDELPSEIGLEQLSTVSVRGRVATITQETDAISEITVVHPKFTVTADLSEIASGLDDIPEPGDEVEITGTIISEDERPTSNCPVPRPRSHQLLPRTPDDFTLLSRQSQWSQARVMSVIGTLLGLVLGFFVLNHLLRRTVERRSIALFNEHAARIRAEIKVEERTRLSVELHDSVSQMLTGIALQIDAALRAVQTDSSRVAKFLALGGRMLASCREELQSCLWEMRSRTFAEKDMTEAIHRTIEPFVQSVDVQTRFNVPRERFSESTAHAILKIVRELVANAVRHGLAKRIRIAGECHGGTVSFSVRDDGCGFNANTAPRPAQGHFGLHGIRERLKSFNGTLDIRSAPGRGTDVTVTLNIAQESDNG